MAFMVESCWPFLPTRSRSTAMRSSPIMTRPGAGFQRQGCPDEPREMAMEVMTMPVEAPIEESPSIVDESELVAAIAG
jgi:hypothetical protein